MLYLIIIFISIIVISAANLAFEVALTPIKIIATLFTVCLGAVAVFAIDGISALIIRRLTPKKWYSPKNKFFTVAKKERNFYRTLKIKAWKDYIPELGGFTGFHKHRLESRTDPIYLERFITEANYGVVIHLANALLGALIAFIPLCSFPSVWIPIFAVNFLLSILPVAILRYTSYTLQRLYERCRKTAKKS